jgi:uncharacterized membrane protein YccC
MPDLPASTLARATQLFCAAALTLLVATSFGLFNPFWAAMPVWVVAQPYRADLLIRALLRLAGTIVGALCGMALLALPLPPYAEIAALALLIGLGTMTAFCIGTIYSYGVLMIAITLGVVVLPGLASPLDAGAYALDRFFCTLIGVIAVTALTFPFTPRRAERHPLRLDHGTDRAMLRGLGALCAAALAATGVVLFGSLAMPAALSLVVFSSIIGSTPDPRPILRNLLPGAAIGVIAALLYRALALSLDLDGIALVVLALPFFAAGALLRSNPRSAPLGLDANMCFLLAAEAGAQAHSLTHYLLGGAMLLTSAGVIVGAHLIAGRVFASPQRM